MDFMRIPWNQALADQVRFTGISRSSGAEVAVIGDVQEDCFQGWADSSNLTDR
jgi:hypothetical protein